MQAKRFIRHILPSIMIGLPLFVMPARAEDVEHAKLGRWSIVYVDVVTSNSCSAFTAFPDKTEIQLALVQTPSQMTWAIFLSNAEWNSMLAARAQVTLSLLTTKSWPSTFSVTTNKAGDKPVLVSPVPTAFIRSIADAQALFIIDDKNEPLTGSFNMNDSEHAIAAVEHCVRQHPLTAPRLARVLRGKRATDRADRLTHVREQSDGGVALFGKAERLCRAQMRCAAISAFMPLLRVNRKWCRHRGTNAFDPKPT